MRARLLGLAGIAVTATAVALAASAGGEVPPEEDDHGAAAAGCAVTETKVASPPQPGQPRPLATPGWIVQDGLWINLGEKSTIIAYNPWPPGSPPTFPPGTSFGVIGPDGSIRIAFHWWRGRKARPAYLRIGGRVLPGPGRGLRAAVEIDDPKRWLVRTALFFRRPGCWQITAKSGEARLRAVVWVVRSEDS